MRSVYIILTAKRKRKDSALTVSNVDFEEGQRKCESITPVNIKFEQEHKKDEPINLGSINLGSVKFDQERSQLDLARMIMLHGYPLEMVEHVGFKMFVKNLQPLFEMTSSALELDCKKIYGKEKQKVYETLHALHGRVSLAVDMWTSPENAAYLRLTANFVDEDWKLQKKILNFITLDDSYTDDILSEVIMKCVMDWDVDRMLFAMTFDDFFLNDDTIFKIKDWLSQNKPLLKIGQLFDMRCAMHVLKSIAWDAVKSLQDVINKIRESIRYVKSSQATQGKFNEVAEQVGINGQRRLFFDCPMQWNSTYLLLETALEYKGAFSVLQEHDAGYSISISEREWEWASSVTGYMKLFFEVINVILGNKHPTANIYFPEICDVYVQLIEWCKNPDDFLSSIALKMKAKFDKFWSKCSLALAVAAILDPRFKMKLIEYYYPQIYGTDAPDHIKEVSEGIKELFNEYSTCLNSLDQDSVRPGNRLPGIGNGTRDRLRGFDKFLHETSQSQCVLSDLEKYLEEMIFPRNHDFNILNWWKVHTPRYPILSMMARDVLAIPLSTLGPEWAFSSSGRILDSHRTSLHPDIREALICGQDWLWMDSEEAKMSSIHSAVPLAIETN
ncbi:zinc finger BED domain-containing protein RICESLEEPER 1-like isoform X2 [Diospyros lotus]|uniref:zinc finger BED domain-containing protein RICESLEEPER 1-like isoform X2 n=1 Tax=Diospyros lotus TaxID=55363 RepID=UPI002259A518|nr:zinc finger BED domain-containing protein RICESLEEPER 1-like isoform X2 [Diospyros lotus]XP_052207489.1 zinc finger BED domain-containing protein RICESLEEPER 1-like isoform X2 [Diospyros lotus]